MLLFLLLLLLLRTLCWLLLLHLLLRQVLPHKLQQHLKADMLRDNLTRPVGSITHRQQRRHSHSTQLWYAEVLEWHRAQPLQDVWAPAKQQHGLIAGRLHTEVAH
jgi:hypothetical protein